MKDTTRRVVILKNVNSDLIEEAILILKNSASDEESSLLSEAEKIVEKYMGKKREWKGKQPSKKTALMLTVGALIAGIGIIATVFFV